MGSKSNNLRRLGELEVDLEKKILWINEAPSSLPVKAVELLCALVENEGDVLSKEDLLNLIWKDSFVEEGVLPQNIYLLRKTFKQYGLNEDLIQTVPRRGYRFVWSQPPTNGRSEITIERETVEETFERSAEFVDETNSPRLELGGRKSRRGAYLAVAAALVTAVVGLGWLWNRTPAGGAKPEDGKLGSIAVSPFLVISDKPENSPIVQRGVAEAIISELKQIRDVRVSEIREIEPYFGASSDPVAMARSLGYASVVTGTVRAEGRDLRVSFELLSTQDGSKALAEAFSIAQSSDVGGERTLALRIARKVDISVAEIRDARSVPAGTLDPEALQAYILARKLPRELDLNRRDEAVGLMRQVVAAAPNWAMGHARLGEAIARADSLEKCPEAIKSADRALELDPANALAHTVYGSCAVLDLNIRKAEESFRKAVELDPDSAAAMVGLGQVLDYQRRFTEAERYLSRALDLEPLWPFYKFNRCDHYYYDKKWDRALADCEQALQLEPGYALAKKRMYWIYVMLRRWDKVRENTFGDLSDDEIRRNPLSKPLAEGDIMGYWRVNLADRLATKRRQHSPMAVATYHSMLGELPETLDLLEQAAAERNYQARYVFADPIWDSVRNEPRYLKLVRDLGLSAAQLPK